MNTATPQRRLFVMRLYSWAVWTAKVLVGIAVMWAFDAPVSADQSAIEQIRERQAFRTNSLRSLHFVERFLDTAANPPVRIEQEWLATHEMFLKASRTIDPKTNQTTPFGWESWDGEHAYQLIYWNSEPGRVMTIQESSAVPFGTWGTSSLLSCLGLRYPGLAKNLTELLSSDEMTVEPLPDKTGFLLRLSPSELWDSGSAQHRLSLWMNRDADWLSVAYLIDPAWITEEHRKQGTIRLKDGEFVTANFTLEFQDIVDPTSKLSYRLPKICGRKEAPIEIEILALNPSLPKSRFRPELSPGVELVTNAGTAAQRRSVLGGGELQLEHQAQTFAEQAASQGAQAVRVTRDAEAAAAPRLLQSWLFWFGFAALAAVFVGGVYRFRNSRL